MEVDILETRTKKEKLAEITSAILKEMPKKKNGWNFTWRTLFKVEGNEVYKLTLQENHSEIEGMLMLTLMNDEMVYMNTIEVAPHNHGSKGKYDNVAGCLIAYACLRSFELGKNNYEGFLTFESKTELIELYHDRYGATLAAGQRMFIEPEISLELIEKYLKLKL